MATKLKKRKPFLAFVTFFISLNMVFALLTGSIYLFAMGTSINTDYKRTGDYYASIGPLLEACYTLATMPEQSEDYQQAMATLRYEGQNIIYMVRAEDGTIPLDTSGTEIPEEFIKMVQASIDQPEVESDLLSLRSLRQGYDHLLVLEGRVLREVLHTRTGITESDKPITMTRYVSNMGPETIAGIDTQVVQNYGVYLAVRSEGAFGNNYGRIYNAYYNWYICTLVMIGLIVALIVFNVILLIVWFRRASLEIACAKLAACTGKIWTEWKILAVLVMFGLAFIILDSGYWDVPIVALAAMAIFWSVWLLANDLKRNGVEVIQNNSIAFVRRVFHRLEGSYPFSERMKRRAFLLCAVEAVLGLLICFCMLDYDGVGIAFAALLFMFGGGLCGYYLYYYIKEIDALDAIVSYTAAIREGTAVQPLRLPEECAFAPMANCLNDIHSGMIRMVDQEVRSERMKVELITNVSHDLKTPLTSIINYVDLLGKEELSPDFANDYVKVLSQKAMRLKNLVQDLFEVSKANSGAIDLNLEQINVVALVEQTTAELDARGAASEVEIKLQCAPPHIVVRADGKKIHRVFENLLGNALKYALAGSRVYVTAAVDGPNAVVTFKNVSNYEMRFTAEEIVERFQRGDASRTTEGSGLGLAIAKSFSELNGGTLRIELDGDLFKAIVTLPLYVPYEVRDLAQEPAGDITWDGSQLPQQVVPQELIVDQADGEPAEAEPRQEADVSVAVPLEAAGEVCEVEPEEETLQSTAKS